MLTLHLYVDADFAGDPYTLKSTSGVHFDIEGPNSRFPWAAATQGQTSRAHSTPEAELAAMNEGMRKKGENAFSIWSLLLGQYHDKDWKLVINLHEDNTTAIVGARTGKNPTMKTLERGFGVQIGWICEKIASGDFNIIHTGTKHMSADIYTKCAQNPLLWECQKKLINVFSRADIEAGNFNPDAEWLLAEIAEGKIPATGIPFIEDGSLNSHYYCILMGESSAHTDFRKAVKVKTPKSKKKAKPKPGAAKPGAKVGYHLTPH